MPLIGNVDPRRASVILTGIQPKIAQTLVDLGADLSSIVTRATLESGIAHVRDR
ncbi:hypothetical protein AB3662_25065 [Sorangium cellulosum]|uniref:hypothetical protein n=1 Tax=Sorangium cellulosum TaxID=56 RepID=UPI003D9A2FD6